MKTITRSGLAACLLLWLITGLCSTSRAALIAVVNASFESPPLSNGSFTAESSGTTAAPGWTIVGGVAGVWNPTLADFSVPLPDGDQIALSNGGILEQVLVSTLTAGTTYMLQVEIGRRINYGFPGYEIGLYAGGQLLAQDHSSVVPAQNSFQMSTVTYQALAGDPHLGQAIEIRIRSFGDQVNFDNVRLDAIGPAPATVPEPAMLASWSALTLLGLVVRLTRCRPAKS